MTLQQEVTLKFTSLNKLWDFVRETRINYTAFNEKDLTLICNCPESDIDLAKEKYGATT